MQESDSLVEFASYEGEHLSEIFSILEYRAQTGARRNLVDRTRRVYDLLAGVYPASTFFFHSKAHRAAIEMAAIQDGSRVLEVATGSGEMFRRLVQENPTGLNVGLDLSPNMAAHTLGRVRQEFPSSRTLLQAVDARHMPFADAGFAHVICCYLFELLDDSDIQRSLAEIRRVLKPGGSFTVILIGQNLGFFNQMYKVAGGLAPAFWGRQVSERFLPRLQKAGFRVRAERVVRQGFYPSRVVVADR